MSNTSPVRSVFYDPAIPEGTTREWPAGSPEWPQGGHVEYVAPEIYFPLQLGHISLVTVVFLNANIVPAPARYQVDDRIAREYWDRYDGCLLPPPVLRAAARAAGEAPGNRFIEFVEEARRAILGRQVSMEEAAEKRIVYRIRALETGASGKLTDYQTAVAEGLTDLFLVERACMEDVIRAERERGPGEPRCEVLHQMEKDTALTFEQYLPAVMQATKILQAIPESAVDRLEAFAEHRAPHWRTGIFITG